MCYVCRHVPRRTIGSASLVTGQRQLKYGQTCDCALYYANQGCGSCLESAFWRVDGTETHLCNESRQQVHFSISTWPTHRQLHCSLVTRKQSAFAFKFGCVRIVIIAMYKKFVNVLRVLSFCLVWMQGILDAYKSWFSVHLKTSMHEDTSEIPMTGYFSKRWRCLVSQGQISDALPDPENSGSQSSICGLPWNWVVHATDLPMSANASWMIDRFHFWQTEGCAAKYDVFIL